MADLTQAEKKFLIDSADYQNACLEKIADDMNLTVNPDRPAPPPNVN